MSAPTPPPDRDDLDSHDGDALRLELAHATVDGELSPEESAGVQPDEQWRALVSQTRLIRDTVQAALAVDGPDPTRRESHLASALAAFDELDIAAAPAPPTGPAISVATPDGMAHVAPAAPSSPPPPGAAAGDELAHRRVARDWASKLPIGIAAAVLAAVVVIGATQLSDDSADTTSLADSGEVAQDRAAGDRDTNNESATADAPGGAPDEGMLIYTLDAKPGSLEAFSESVSATGRGGTEMPSRVMPTQSPEFAADCTKFDVIELLGPGVDADEVTMVEGVVDGRDVVGVVDRTNPNDVTVIDLEGCEVVSER